MKHSIEITHTHVKLLKGAEVVEEYPLPKKPKARESMIRNLSAKARKLNYNGYRIEMRPKHSRLLGAYLGFASSLNKYAKYID